MNGNSGSHLPGLRVLHYKFSYSLIKVVVFMEDKLAELKESIEMLEDILNYAYEGYVLVDP